MPVEMKLWEINEDKLSAATPFTLDKEERLEDWIVEDIELLDANLLLIGRQVTTGWGGRLDLLAIDPAAQLVVIELKRDLTPREVLAQVLEYASWVDGLSYDEVAEIAQTFLGTSLPEAFQDAFGEELPVPLSGSQRLIVLASELDEHTESTLRYLSERWGMDVNAVFFRCFESPSDGRQLLGRSWLMEPSEVESRKVATDGWTSSTMEELQQMAEESGAGDALDRLLRFGEEHGLRPWQAAWKLSLRGHFGGSRFRKLFGTYPGDLSEPGRIFSEVAVGVASEYFGVDEKVLRSALPEPIPGRGDAYLLSVDDIDRLAGAVSDR